MRTHLLARSALRTTALLLVVLLLVAATALPVAAGTRGPIRDDRNRRIAVGDITVVAGEVVDGPLVGVDGRARIGGTVDGSAVVIRGDLVVEAGGVVDGDVIVARGDARITGTVRGDVVVLGGRAVVRSDALVRGDVSSTDAPAVARGARVTGDVEDIDLLGIAVALGAGLLLFWWLAVTVSTALLGVLLLALLPRVLDAGNAVGRDAKRWWIALLVGAGLLVGVPVLAVAAISSLVGLPFGFGLLGALGFVHALGYVTSAYLLGRLIMKEPKNRFGAFFVGWGILRVVALAPLFGILVWIAAALFGMGMLAVAAFRAGQVPRTPRPSTPSPTEPTTPATEPTTPATPSSAPGPEVTA